MAVLYGDGEGVGGDDSKNSVKPEIFFKNIINKHHSLVIFLKKSEIMNLFSET